MIPTCPLFSLHIITVSHSFHLTDTLLSFLFIMQFLGISVRLKIQVRSEAEGIGDSVPEERLFPACITACESYRKPLLNRKVLLQGPAATL